MSSDADPKKRSVSITISEWPSFRDDLRRVNLTEPQRVALLPLNVEKAATFAELVHANDSVPLVKLARLAKVPFEDVTPAGTKLPKQSLHSVDWVGPTLAFTQAIISNPAVMSVYLGLVSNYLYDLFKGRENDAVVKFSIVVEKRKSRSYAKIVYEGPLEGLKSLPKSIRRACK